MANIIQNIAGMGNMTEEIIASDALTAAKAGIKMYAAALTEATNTEVRELLRNYFNVAVEAHQKITNYMIEKNYYYPYDNKKQISKDIEAANKIINMEE